LYARAFTLDLTYHHILASQWTNHTYVSNATICLAEAHSTCLCVIYVVHSKITFATFVDVSLFNTFFQFTNSRIISRPILLLRTLYINKSTNSNTPLRKRGLLIAESQHFHHCYLLAIFSIIPIPILRTLAQPLRRSVSTVHTPCPKRKKKADTNHELRTTNHGRTKT